MGKKPGKQNFFEQARALFQKLVKHPSTRSKLFIVGAGVSVVVIAAGVVVGTSPAVMDELGPTSSPKSSTGTSPSPSGKTSASASPSASPSASASGSSPSPSASSSVSPSASSPSVAPPTERQRDAMEMAQNEVNASSHSRVSLIQTLEFFGFTSEDSRYAVYAIDFDWNSTAAIFAQDFIINATYSKQAVINLLRADEFTLAEATYGVNIIGADWVQEATDFGSENLSNGWRNDGTRYTRERMITVIINGGFTQSEADQAAIFLGEAAWNQEAIMMTADICFDLPGRVELDQELVAYGFTQNQADWATERMNWYCFP